MANHLSFISQDESSCSAKMPLSQAFRNHAKGVRQHKVVYFYNSGLAINKATLDHLASLLSRHSNLHFHPIDVQSNLQFSDVSLVCHEACLVIENDEGHVVYSGPVPEKDLEVRTLFSVLGVI